MNTNIHIPSLLTNGTAAAAAAPAGSEGDKLYAICTLATYNAIHRSVNEGCVLAKRMETKLTAGRVSLIDKLYYRREPSIVPLIFELKQNEN